MKDSLLKASDRIFVAGHRGMAGSAIVRCLKQSGYGSHSNGGAILTVSRDELDLRDYLSVKRWFDEHEPSVVVLAAAKVGGIYANASMPTDFLLSNLKIQNNVIETAWRSGVRRLLFLGSSCIYPKFAQQPIREESLLSGFLEPTNQAYAIAKIAGIELCRSLRSQHGFDALTLMPTNLYGQGDNYHPTNSHVMASFIRRFLQAAHSGANHVSCWGSGKPLREFLHVDDLASAVVFCLQHWDPAAVDAPRGDNGHPLEYLNVGSGQDLSIGDLANLVAETCGYSGSILWDSSFPDGSPRKLLDVSRLASLGWRASISLEHGVRSTIAQLREQTTLLQAIIAGSDSAG